MILLQCTVSPWSYCSALCHHDLVAVHCVAMILLQCTVSPWSCCSALCHHDPNAMLCDLTSSIWLSGQSIEAIWIVPLQNICYGALYEMLWLQSANVQTVGLPSLFCWPSHWHGDRFVVIYKWTVHSYCEHVIFPDFTMVSTSCMYVFNTSHVSSDHKLQYCIFGNQDSLSYTAMRDLFATRVLPVCYIDVSVCTCLCINVVCALQWSSNEFKL